MIIQGSTLSLTASHVQQSMTHESESMRAWVDGGAPTGGTQRAGDPGFGRARGRGLPPGQPPVPPGRSAAPPGQSPVHAHRSARTSSATGEDDGSRLLSDPVHTGRLSQLVALVERLTGQRVRVLDPADLDVPAGSAPGTDAVGSADRGAGSAPERAGWGLDYTYTRTTVEQEATSFHATGTVTTADGRQIDLAAELELYRSAMSTSTTRITAGDALVDPLLLSFGTAPALSGQTANLDLDGDGNVDEVPVTAAGSAYLVLDRNGNGVVDDGTELFGPATGNGFAELSGYDGDGNGWIDQADPVFSQLRLWQGTTQTLATLADRGVGAIGLANVGTPFTLAEGSGGEGRPLGQLQASGVWLGEDGSVGTVHEVDVQT